MTVHRFFDNQIILIRGRCEQVLPQFKPAIVAMVCSDLPYGTTANDWDTPIDLKDLWRNMYRVSTPRTPYVMFAATPFHITLGASNIENLKYDWIWNKQRGSGHLNAKIQPMRSHEHILTFYRSQCTYNPQMRDGAAYTREKARNRRSSTNYGYDSVDDIVTVNNGGRYPITSLYFNQCSERLHPNQKPIDLLEYLLRTFTNEGDLVLDPTMGVGSTAVACRNIGRRCIGIESDIDYFNIAVARINGEL